MLYSAPARTTAEAPRPSAPALPKSNREFKFKGDYFNSNVL